MSSPQFRVGQRVRIADGTEGWVRFAGTTSFKEGEWLGLELDAEEGKNDGSVLGERYFECPPNHGLFVQAKPNVKIIANPPPPAPRQNGKPASQAPKSRPSSVTAPSPRPRQSISGLSSKRASIAPSSAPFTSTTTRRQSMAPPPQPTAKSSRPSISSRSLSPKKPTTTKSSRPSMSGTSSLTTGRSTLQPSKNSSPSPGVDRVLSPLSPGSGSNGNGKPPAPRATASSGPPASVASRGSLAGNKDRQELESKLRIHEKQLLDARDRIKGLESAQQQAEQFKGALEKLQSKAREQFKEINELKKQLKERDDHFEKVESQLAEHESVLEMATLDREMAEEKADAFEAELKGLQSRLQDLETENEILRADNDELGKDMTPEERASQGWIQMQTENTRLREALLRLRDMTDEREEALKAEIELLEEDSQELVTTTDKLNELKEKCLGLEAEMDDLKEQLDANLGSESMVEELTDRNLAMSDQIEEMKNKITDLESMNELNEELLESHDEHEKQMQQIIDSRDSTIADQARWAISKEEEAEEYKYTISKFRELVIALQSDIQNIQASKKLTEAEAQELGSHSRTMMDLNRQLQASAMSTQVKTIEMELRKMEAQEASEHLAIVQLFLPDAFQAERDSVLALLRFKRVSFKSTLLNSFLKERVASPRPHAHLDQLLSGCDAMEKLTWVSAMCKRFINGISMSSLEDFAKFESAYHELEVVERTLNGYIENLRKDDLQEQKLSEGLQRSIAVMQHLSEVHLRDGVESYVEEVLMSMLLTQSHLETISVSLMLTKNEVLKTVPASEDGDDEMSQFSEKMDTLAMQSRGAKVIVGKILHSLEDLKTQNLALSLETQPNVKACETTAAEFASSLRALGLSLDAAMNDDTRVSPFGFADLLSSVRSFNASQFKAADADVFIPLQANLKSLHQRLSDIYAVASDLSNTVEFEGSEPPWVLRSKELKSSKHVSADAEQENANLKRELNERGTTIKLRDQTLEEKELTIELLQGKLRDVQKKNKQITDLEKDNDALHANERKLQEKIEKLAQLNARLEEERDRWMRNASELKNRDSSISDLKRAGAEMVGTSAQMESLKQDIEVLESTCRYLRQQARRSQMEEAARKNTWLHQPLLPPRKDLEQEQARKDSMQAFENLAMLPVTAKPVAIIDARTKEERLKWKPMKTSVAYQLAEAEMHWLYTWEAPRVLKQPYDGRFGQFAGGDAVEVV
ncbi:hypothetical protein FKW77_009033 [Venturia effusa]|uniref:CAP-Gly domain-containing protein n=1 Tax=Venturia effusa TaxID=50376 RepID=A0A517LEG3_9PEZI|nr:hypothetical protein FKW77_009033 [Venturia effusa]